MKPFEPEFAGKMNFYLSAVEDQSRHADDKPCIGLLPRKNSFIRGWLLHHPGREIRSREIGNRQRALRQDGYAGVGTELHEVFAHGFADVATGYEMRGAANFVRQRTMNQHACLALDERLNLRLPLLRSDKTRRGKQCENF